MNVTPHVAAKAKGSAIDGRTTRHAGYGLSQRIRKRIEEPFGWGKTVGPIAKTMLRGLERAGTSSSTPSPPTTFPACPSSLPHEAEKAQRGPVHPAAPGLEEDTRRIRSYVRSFFSSL